MRKIELKPRDDGSSDILIDGENHQIAWTKELTYDFKHNHYENLEDEVLNALMGHNLTLEEAQEVIRLGKTK